MLTDYKLGIKMFDSRICFIKHLLNEVKFRIKKKFHMMQNNIFPTQVERELPIQALEYASGG